MHAHTHQHMHKHMMPHSHDDSFGLNLFFDPAEEGTQGHLHDCFSCEVLTPPEAHNLGENGYGVTSTSVMLNFNDA